MKSKKNLRCSFKFLIFICFSVIFMNGCSTANATTQPEGSTNFILDAEQISIDMYPAYADAYIGGASNAGNWAAFTAIGGEDYQEQLNNKIAFLEKIYAEKNERFIVREGISFDEVTNTGGIKYLYENSELYRSLVNANDNLYIASDSSFFVFSDNEQSTIYERYVFSIDSKAELNLSLSYSLEKGKMSVWIISPDGEYRYQNDLTTTCNDKVELSLDEGVYSVVLVYELSDGGISGERDIQGTFR